MFAAHYSERKRNMKADMDACEAIIRHFDSCPDCKDDHQFCSTGQELYAAFQSVQARIMKGEQVND